jgi:RNA polymerase sigma-70 factor (ECF subfamily)
MEKGLESIFLDALERNKDRVYRICCLYSIENDDPKDLFQEVLLNLWKSLPTFRQESSIDTWMYRVTLNVCLRAKQFAVNKQKHFVKMESILYQNIEEKTDTIDSYELYQKLTLAIKQLEGVDKSIILLHLEGISHKQIGEVLGLTENHIAVRIKRAKSKLLTLIKS